MTAHLQSTKAEVFFLFLQSQASRPEQSVMQALESLTETQVRDCFSVFTLK